VGAVVGRLQGASKFVLAATFRRKAFQKWLTQLDAGEPKEIKIVETPTLAQIQELLPTDGRPATLDARGGDADFFKNVLPNITHSGVFSKLLFHAGGWHCPIHIKGLQIRQLVVEWSGYRFQSMEVSNCWIDQLLIEESRVTAHEDQAIRIELIVFNSCIGTFDAQRTEFVLFDLRHSALFSINLSRGGEDLKEMLSLRPYLHRGKTVYIRVR
jgi:hypothetical protein